MNGFTLRGILGIAVFALSAMVITPPAHASAKLGCFKDAEKRDLVGHMEKGTPNSAAKCIKICHDKKLPFAATQAGEWCMCGRQYGTLGPSEECKTPCPGNEKEMCGGKWANSVYSTGLYPTKEVGCFKDTKEKRDLDGFLGKSNDGKTSHGECIETCRMKHFKYAGLQAGAWCACGNTYGSHGKATNCNQKCVGTPAQICGGAFANLVFDTGFEGPEAKK